MKKTSNLHPVVHAVGHRHFISGFHISAVALGIWAVAMAWMTAFSFTSNIQYAAAAGTVSGRILAGGTGVQTSRVFLTLGQAGQPPATTGQTDQFGNFSLTNVPDGSNYVLSIAINDSTFPYLNKTVKDITVTSGGTNLGDINLSAATKTVTGRVMREDGTAVTDAQVMTFMMGGVPGESSNYSANTDSTGTYTIRLGPGTYGIQVSAQWDHQTNKPKEVTWVYTQTDGPPPQIAFSGDATESYTQNFTVKTATVKVKGKLLYPDSAPVQFSGVSLRSSTGAMVNGSTSTDGTFSINTTPGSYEFNVFLPPDKSQYSSKPKNFTATDNQTIDLGSITLTQKTSRISGMVKDANGVAIAGVNINAFVMGNFTEPGKGPSGPPAFTTTSAEGTYVMYVDAGKHGINLFLPPDKPYTYNDPPKEVTVTDGQLLTGVDFVLQKADVTINGTVVNSTGATVTNFFAFANLEAASTTNGPGKFLGGGPIQNGTFRILTSAAAASKVCVGAFPPPDSGYSVKERTCFDITSGQTYNVKLTLVTNDATLTGKIVDKNGATLTDVRGEVFLNGPAGHKFGRIENGTYTISVASGTKWHFGYHTQSTTYLNEPTFEEVTIKAGANSKNIVMSKADATITGTLLDPDGNTIPFGFVHAHEPFDPSKKQEPGKGPRGFGGPVNGGSFSIPAMAGTYEVGAGLPPEYSTKGWMPPEFSKVTVVSGGTAKVMLKFGKADGSMSGKVTDASGNSVRFGFCGGWSDKGSHTGGPIQDGSFMIQLKKNDTWHLNCNSFENNKHYTSGEVKVTTANSTGFTLSQNFKLKESPFTPPEPISETFDATEPKTISVGEGNAKYEISIPSGALDDSGDVRLVVEPTESVQPTENDKIPTGFGLEITAYDEDNNPITDLNSNVTITMPAFCDELEDSAGIDVEDLKSKYYDDTSGAWKEQTGTVADANGDGKNCEYTVTTDHFTTFALTTSLEGVAKAKAVKIGKNKKGLSTFTVDGKTVTPFSCKGTLRADTAIVDGTQLVAAGSSCNTAVKVYDTAGKLKKQIKTSSKVSGIDFVDVTKDDDADIIVSPLSGTKVLVAQPGKKYKMISVSVSSAPAQLAASGVTFSGDNASLVAGVLRGGRLTTPSVFNFSKSAFSKNSTRSTAYQSAFKVSNGSLSLSLGNLKITAITPGSVSKSKKNATLTIKGANLTPDTVVTIGGTVTGKVTGGSSGTLTVQFDASKLSKGKKTVKLTNPNGKTASKSITIK